MGAVGLGVETEGDADVEGEVPVAAARAAAPAATEAYEGSCPTTIGVAREPLGARTPGLKDPALWAAQRKQCRRAYLFVPNPQTTQAQSPSRLGPSFAEG